MEGWISAILTLILALTWLGAMEQLSARGVTTPHTTRKLVHIGTGPIFMACWAFFPETATARYWAATVPLLITIRFALIGLGLVADPKTVQSMSRSGNPRELLRGPLSYGVIFVLSTVLWYTSSPLGILALLILCAGDGFADLVGRRFGKGNALPWNRSKSVAGSAAFFVAASVSSILFLAWFESLGFLPLPNIALIFLLTLIATFVESLPVNDWDNVTVFLSVIFAGSILSF